jgi:hypothetical protein
MKALWLASTSESRFVHADRPALEELSQAEA